MDDWPYPKCFLLPIIIIQAISITTVRFISTQRGVEHYLNRFPSVAPFSLYTCMYTKIRKPRDNEVGRLGSILIMFDFAYFAIITPLMD